MPEKVDTLNRFLVGAIADRIIIMNPPHCTIPKDDALNLAAWIVAMVDDEDRFAEVLAAVKST